LEHLVWEDDLIAVVLGYSLIHWPEADPETIQHCRVMLTISD
jgi:hypothetical protein